MLILTVLQLSAKEDILGKLSLSVPHLNSKADSEQDTEMLCVTPPTFLFLPLPRFREGVGALEMTGSAAKKLLEDCEEQQLEGMGAAQGRAGRLSPRETGSFRAWGPGS